MTRSTISTTTAISTAALIWMAATCLAYQEGRRRGRSDQLNDGQCNASVDVVDIDGGRGDVESNNTTSCSSTANRSSGTRIINQTTQHSRKKIREQDAEKNDTQLDNVNNNNHEVNKSNTLQSLPIYPIATLTSIYRLCVGTPRQGMLAPHSRGIVTFHENKLSKDSVLELANYSHVYVMFVFHLNSNFGVWADTFGAGNGAALDGNDSNNSKDMSTNNDSTVSDNNDSATRTKNGNNNNKSDNKNKKNKKKMGQRQFPSKIAPPSLGGKKVGVFSTRTPHRPNPIGFSLCRLDGVIANKDNKKGGGGGTFSLLLSGLDIVDGTPILDVKPYVPHYDCVGYPFNGSDAVSSSSSLVSTLEHSVNDSSDGTHTANDPTLFPTTATNSKEKSIPTQTDPTNTNLPNSVKVPHWVDSGLQKRRKVTFLPKAEQFFHDLTTTPETPSDAASDANTVPASPSMQQLQFYGPHSPWKDSPSQAVNNIKHCIHELLGVDVRSAWQTKKARKGKFHAERSSRVKDWKGNDAGNESKDESGTNGGGGDDAVKEAEVKGMCTQQIDNLLVQFTIEEPSSAIGENSANFVQSSSANSDGKSVVDERSKGSGAEDIVLVHSVSFIKK